MARSGLYCNWRVICYPDRLKLHWEKILESNMICFAKSPLHEFDFWSPDDPHFDPEKHNEGEQKEPHYHLVIHFGSAKSWKQIREISTLVTTDESALHVIPVIGDIGSAVRYLSHFGEDPYKKHIYNKDDIESYNGFDVVKYFKLTKEQEADLTSDIRHFIISNKIFEYSDLLDILGDTSPGSESYSDNRDMYIYVLKHTIMINAYLRSHKFRNMPKKEGTIPSE